MQDSSSAGPSPALSHPPLRYRCLLLDHDDTTVRSTETIHYPAHVESVRVLRPDLEPCTLRTWFEKCHEPGISAYLGSLFSQEQMTEEVEIWRRALEGSSPRFYEGMAELLMEFRERGGVIAVISHSPADMINKHYQSHALGTQIKPDMILGWDDNPQRRKPAPWPALHALEQLQVEAKDAILLDDLAPGISMARATGVAAAGAGWGHSVPSIERHMRKECDFYFKTVAEFATFLLQAHPHSAL